MSVLNCLNNFTISDQITEVLSLGAINTPVQATSAPNYQFTNGTSSSGTVPNVIDQLGAVRRERRDARRARRRSPIRCRP